MLRPVNIEILTEDQYCTKLKMDFSKSSLTNISVKQQKEEYSLKKETYGATSSDDDINNDDRSKISDKSSDDEGNRDGSQKSLGEESLREDDEKKPSSLIKSDAIKSYDILCGRDKATFNNVGNRRFRVLISLNIPRYEKATTKAEKASVIKYICNIFRNEVGVRFLKKHKSGEGYYELSVSEARKKVGHALRDMSVARQEVKKRRDEMRKSSLRQQAEYNRNTRRMSGMDFDPMLEPLPIGEEANRKAQNQQQQQQSSTKAHWMDQQSKTSTLPDILTQHLQQQQPSSQRQAPQQQFTTLQEKLLDLQKQQQQLQQEREALLRQQQYQQELLEQQIRNRRLRNQQWEQLQQQQQQNHSQPQNPEEGDFHQFDHLFEAISRQQKRRR